MDSFIILVVFTPIIIEPKIVECNSFYLLLYELSHSIECVTLKHNALSDLMKSILNTIPISHTIRVN